MCIIIGMYCVMMTSSNGNIFHVTGPYTGNSPATCEFPAQRPVTRSFDVFLPLAQNKRLHNREAGDLSRHCAHYDVIVIVPQHTCGAYCHSKISHEHSSRAKSGIYCACFSAVLNTKKETLHRSALWGIPNWYLNVSKYRIQLLSEDDGHHMDRFATFPV